MFGEGNKGRGHYRECVWKVCVKRAISASCRYFSITLKGGGCIAALDFVFMLSSQLMDRVYICELVSPPLPHSPLEDKLTMFIEK